MSTTRIISDPGRVFAFVRSHVPMSATVGMQGLGLERDGELVAGVLYEGFNGQNAWIHVAAEPSKRWMTREYLMACFRYPFMQLGVKRLSGYVDASNTDARRLDEHLGFREEARLTGAAEDGGDVILYVMWRQDCRFLAEKNHDHPK
jgi:RimJ/RimL family protein N-acetyltransferase